MQGVSTSSPDYGTYLAQLRMPPSLGHLQLVMISGDWCGPCKGIKPQLPQVAQILAQYGIPLAIHVVELVQQNQAQVMQFTQALGFQSVPTFVLYGPGLDGTGQREVLVGHEGVMVAPQIANWIRESIQPSAAQ